MILVNKDEAEYIKRHSDYIRISITCKNKKSSRKKHYVDEYPETFRLLAQYREELKSKKQKGE